MELSWLYAWALFLSRNTAEMSFPAGIALAAHLASFATAYAFRNRNSRMIWRVVGHGIVLGLTLTWVERSGFGRVFPLAGNYFQWYQMGLAALLATLFWYKGLKRPGRQMSYHMVCNYFDLAMGMFFALLLLKLIVWYKTGTKLPDPFLPHLMTGGLFFGLVAIFFSNTPVSRKKQYVQGFGKTGVLVTFFAGLLLSGTGIIFALLGFLTSTADSGYLVLKKTTSPLGPYLISILRFLLVPSRHSGSTVQAKESLGLQAASGSLPVADHAGWLTPVLSYGFLGVMIIVGVLFLGMLTLKTWRFLMSRSGHPGRQRCQSGFLDAAIQRARLFFRHLIQSLKILCGRVDNGIAAFNGLMAWGRKCGMPRRACETPEEYAIRLGTIFTPLQDEIYTVTDALHQEIYAETPLNYVELVQVSEALKKLHHPTFWMLRLKVWWQMI